SSCRTCGAPVTPTRQTSSRSTSPSSAARSSPIAGTRAISLPRPAPDTGSSNPRSALRKSSSGRLESSGDIQARGPTVRDGHGGSSRTGHRGRVLRGDLRPSLDAGARLMSAGDAFGLAISLAVLIYLVYALFRGEKL